MKEVNKQRIMKNEVIKEIIMITFCIFSVSCIVATIVLSSKFPH